MWANIHNRNQTGYFSHVGEYTLASDYKLECRYSIEITLAIFRMWANIHTCERLQVGIFACGQIYTCE